jgi:hypothetical protein
MRILNISTRRVTLNFRNGAIYDIEPSAWIERPDSETDYLDDNAATLALFSSGQLVLQATGGGAWAGAPLPALPDNDPFPALLPATYSNQTRQLTPDSADAVRGAVRYIVGLVPDSVAAAGKNASLIQSALDAKGTVVVDCAGDVYIDKTLVIGGNTSLRTAPGTTYRLTGGNGKNMLQTAAYTRAKVPVTLSWTSGFTASVNWAAHARSVGSYIWLSGGAPSMFIGVFHILSVTDANNFVIDLVRLPTGAPSGSWTACAADENITVDGGVFNYDGLTNFVVPNDTNKHCTVFSGVAGLRVRNVTVDNAHKYCFATGALNNARFENIGTHFNYADCLKMYGPCFDTHVDGLWGKTGDDSVTFQSKEGALYTQFAWTFGDIINCSVRNVNTYSEHNTIGVFSSDDEIIDQVVFDNIRGLAADTGANIGAQQSSGFTQGNIGHLTIKNFAATGKLNMQMAIGYYCNIQELVLDGFVMNSAGQSGIVGVFNQANATVSALTIRDPLMNLGSSVPGTVQLVVNSGVIRNLNVTGGRLRKNGAGGCTAVSSNSGATFTTINFYGTHFDNDVLPVVLASGVLGSPSVSLNQCIVSGTSQGILNTSVNSSLNLNGNTMSGISWGALFIPGGTPSVSLRSSGNNMISGSWVGVTGGAPVISVFGWDIRVAPNATGIARTAGSFCTNSGAGVGTLVQNNAVICDASGAANSWKQVSDTSKTY